MLVFALRKIVHRSIGDFNTSGISYHSDARGLCICIGNIWFLAIQRLEHGQLDSLKGVCPICRILCLVVGVGICYWQLRLMIKCELSMNARFRNDPIDFLILHLPSTFQISSKMDSPFDKSPEVHCQFS